MRSKIAAIAFIAFFCAMCAQARIVRGYTCDSGASGITLLVDSIDFRPGLTRLYGKLKGQPHTAQRIDNLTVEGQMSPKPAHWTDVEGIDMKRWFQWEDSGLIEVEIDFPPLKDATSAVIVADGPKGQSTWKISRKASVGKQKRIRRK